MRIITYDEIIEKGHFSAGQYFDIKIEYTEIIAEEFKEKMYAHKTSLKGLFAESAELEKDIMNHLDSLKYE